MKLRVSIELNGVDRVVGMIEGRNAEDACFCYDEDYLRQSDGIRISASLPLRPEPFSPEQTKNYFDGLLPEGYTRKTVAQWLHHEENDYLRILAALGKECLGALKVIDADNPEEVPCSYEKLSLEQVRALAQEGATASAELVTRAHLSLTGASGKVGLYFNQANGQWYLPIGSAPSTHIVKQSHVRLDAIVTNEQLAILTARKVGISVPETFLINTGDYEDGDILFATARYDRIWHDQPVMAGSLPMPLRLHQEDFGQALGLPSSAKYEQEGAHHFRDMFRILRQYSSDPIQDQLKLWDLVVFNFLLGNTDAHLKNYSLLYGQNPKNVRLAPAYDLISTTAYKSSTRDMSFRIGGKLSVDEINREAFAAAAEEVEIGRRIAMQRFDFIAGLFEPSLRQAAQELSYAGYHKADAIMQRVLETGGIHNL